MVRVLDASALIAYLEKQAGYEKVKDAFVEATQKEEKLLMTTVNWGEVYYVLIRNLGIERAKRILQLIDTFPIELIPPDIELVILAAYYKAVKKLPYVDSFAAALAKHNKADLLTTDREFKLLEREIKIFWIE